MVRTLCLLLLLAGCASTGDLAPAPATTNVPTPTPCLTRDKVPAKPDFVTDAQILAVPEERVVFVLGSDRLARQVYEGKLEATIAGCVGEKPVPGQVELPKPEAKPWWKF